MGREKGLGAGRGKGEGMRAGAGRVKRAGARTGKGNILVEADDRASSAENLIVFFLMFDNKIRYGEI